MPALPGVSEKSCARLIDTQASRQAARAPGRKCVTLIDTWASFLYAQRNGSNVESPR